MYSNQKRQYKHLVFAYCYAVFGDVLLVWYNLLGNSKNWLKMAYFDVFEQMFY